MTKFKRIVLSIVVGVSVYCCIQARLWQAHALTVLHKARATQAEAESAQSQAKAVLAQRITEVGKETAFFSNAVQQLRALRSRPSFDEGVRCGFYAMVTATADGQSYVFEDMPTLLSQASNVWYRLHTFPGTNLVELFDSLRSPPAGRQPAGTL